MLFMFYKLNSFGIMIFVLALALTPGGGVLAMSGVFQPVPLETMRAVPVTNESRKLDAEVIVFLRGKYKIKSGHYYQVPAEIPWIAVSKSIQNQMAEKSIPKQLFEWYEPGLDFVEIYPQSKSDIAFAVAMLKGTKSNSKKLVGFYVLAVPAAAPKK